MVRRQGQDTRHIDHQSIRALLERRERLRDVSRITHGNRLQHHILRLRRKLLRLEKGPEHLPGPDGWVVEENHTGYGGDGVVEQLNGLGLTQL